MKKLINSPDDAVREELEGMQSKPRDRIRVSLDPFYVARRDAPKRGKVGLVSGGATKAADHPRLQGTQDIPSVSGRKTDGFGLHLQVSDEAAIHAQSWLELPAWNPQKLILRSNPPGRHSEAVLCPPSGRVRQREHPEPSRRSRCKFSRTSGCGGRLRICGK